MRMPPGEIERLLAERQRLRAAREYAAADALLQQLTRGGVQVLDRPLSSGEAPAWEYRAARVDIPKTNIAELVRQATDALGAEGGDGEAAGRLVGALCEDIKRQLQLLFGADGAPLSLGEVGLARRELQGRMFGDAAFALAMAGARDDTLFRLLARGAVFELGRIGRRASCRPVDLYQIAERFACAGVLEQVTLPLYTPCLYTHPASIHTLPLCHTVHTPVHTHMHTHMHMPI
jgi:hypothetical protein